MEKYIVRYLYLGEVREQKISQYRLAEFLTYPNIELISVRRLSRNYGRDTGYHKQYKHNKHDTQKENKGSGRNNKEVSTL